MSHVINHAVIGEKPCINKAIHTLLMHGYAVNAWLRNFQYAHTWATELLPKLVVYCRALEGA